jgi:hypothetical protein
VFQLSGKGRKLDPKYMKLETVREALTFCIWHEGLHQGSTLYFWAVNKLHILTVQHTHTLGAYFSKWLC